MSARVTLRQLRGLVALAEEQCVPELIELEIRDGYVETMKEHDRCVRLFFESTEIEVAMVKRYGRD